MKIEKYLKQVLAKSSNQLLSPLSLSLTAITKRENCSIINIIDHKTTRDLIHLTNRNGIDKKTSRDTYKPVQKPIHKSTSSDGGFSCELCA